jgi:hypothetical protein|tara:strand:- start:211 stop:459 length:249 start_codon:yes stop_codon:yes gene_type:complete
MKYEVQGDVIVNSRGDVMAHRVYGVWETKNDEVLEFIAELEKPVKAKEVKKVVKAKKRAHNEDGSFKADDPKTPDVNEAWEE